MGEARFLCPRAIVLVALTCLASACSASTSVDTTPAELPSTRSSTGTGSPAGSIKPGPTGSQSSPAGPASTPTDSRPDFRVSQSKVLAAIPGSNKPTCQAVGDKKDVRSGGFAVGNFADARAQYKSAKPSPMQSVGLYAIPQHAAKMPGVTIILKQLNATGAERKFVSHSVQTADVWSYYAVQLPIPTPGVWRLSVSSGQDHGCFEVAFKK